MAETSVLVWDLETVPDLAAVARIHGLEGEPEEVVREALAPKFPKHPPRTGRRDIGSLTAGYGLANARP